VQKKSATGPLSAAAPQAQTPAPLPQPLRRNAEALGGFSLADVRVHHDSAEPSKLGALAFARGNDIHLAPGQEKHLPHEAWHVVQQKQGRVKTTNERHAQLVNDDPGLEAEADRMAGGAMETVPCLDTLHLPRGLGQVTTRALTPPASTVVAQLQADSTSAKAEDEPPLGILINFDRKARRALGLTKADLERVPPAFLVQMFQAEYGIQVGVANGRLTYLGDAQTTNKVSPLAREMWLKQLTTHSPHELSFTANSKKVEFGNNVDDPATDSSSSLFDIGDFSLTGDMPLRGAIYKSVPQRAANFARVLEHEMLGHGVMHLGDDYSRSKHKENHGSFFGYKDPGNTVDFGNILAGQMDLPIRTVYGAQAGSKFKHGGKSYRMSQLTFRKDGRLGRVIFNEGASLGWQYRPDWYKGLKRKKKGHWLKRKYS
jgi:hypothetical protein